MDTASILDLALDTLLDSLKVLGISFFLYILLSFFENKIALLLERKKKMAPLFGSLAGAIPQCGVSVVGADLYSKDHLTLGTLIAIFIACSDEALPILFSDFEHKWYMGFIVVAIKIIYATIVGILLDLIFRKENKEVERHLDECEGENEVHVGCCHHSIEENESPIHEHLLHPLLHSLKIFVFTYVISFLFGLLILGVGEDNLSSFLSNNYYLSPLFATIVGLIPNCAASVLISNLYIEGFLPFGSLLAGLSASAGLGSLYLFKDKNHFSRAFMVLGLQIAFSFLLGYATIWFNI